MIHNYDEYQLLYRSLIYYSQNKQSFDDIVNKKIGKSTSLLSCETSTNEENDENPLITHDAEGNEFFDGYLVYDYTGVNLDREDSDPYVYWE